MTEGELFSERCPFCNQREATLLCDFLIGFEWKGDEGDCHIGITLKDGRRSSMKTGEKYRCTATDGEMFTCDRPICTDCALNTGWIHYGKKLGFDTIDLCPQCAPNDNQGDFKVVTKEEADTIRTTMWRRSIGLLKEVVH